MGTAVVLESENEAQKNMFAAWCHPKTIWGFCFVLNSNCAASNLALSTAMGLFSVVKLRAPCKGSIVVAPF